MRREMIDNRDATVAFIDADFNPVDEADAKHVKVLFDDGEIAFFTPSKDDAPAATDEEAKKAAAWQAIKDQSLKLLQRDGWEDVPREPDGKWTTGGGSGGSEAGADKPAADKPTAVVADTPAPAVSAGGKKKAEIADFAKDDVAIDSDTRSNPEKGKKFIEEWNEKIAAAPAEFKNKFLGGQKATMHINYHDNDDKLTINGSLLTEQGRTLGTYTRTLNFASNKASSDYFKINDEQEGKGVGKKVLAGNMAVYQQLGFDSVSVHANIDVGGYAWAKYGYVPTRSSWRGLSSDIENKIDRLSGGGGVGADSWDELSIHDQNRVYDAWARSTRSDFQDSEMESWRDSGQPLEDAKNDLVTSYNDGSEISWVEHAIDGYRKERTDNGKSDIPFSNNALTSAIYLDYSSRYQDGRGDVEVTFQDQKLTEPTTAPDPAQGTLPGVPAIEPHEYLTPEMRDGIERALDKGFDSEAEKKADDADPPDFGDGIEQSQSDYWDSMSDDDRFQWAKDNAPDFIGDSEGEGAGEMDPADADRLRTLANSDDPKALWLIADSKYGKDILLHSDWNGVIDMHDKQTMDRFNAYVGKAKAA
jgi:hypothetical protein